MGRSSKLPASWPDTPEQGRSRGAFAAIVFAAVFCGWVAPSLAALPCGEKPEEIPADLAAKVKTDTQGRADLILQAAASTELRGLAAAKRRELWAKYPTVEKSTLDHYLLWTTCQTLSKDPAQDGAQKYEEYATVYRIMSEPIFKPSSHAE